MQSLQEAHAIFKRQVLPSCTFKVELADSDKVCDQFVKLEIYKRN